MLDTPADSTDTLTLYGTALSSRLLLGTALYASPAQMAETVAAAQPGMVTVALRREMAQAGAGRSFHDLVAGFGVPLLPNTAGCRTAREAITTALMARELFTTSLVKLEVIANDDTLAPDVFGLVEAAGELTRQGFRVLPYCTEDLGVAERLLSAGCEVLMPWGAPIGSGRGLANRAGLAHLRAWLPGVPLIVDAGLGAPSHAAAAMELGYDGVLLNTAIAKARDPVRMGAAFAQAVAAARAAFLAGLMPERDMAAPSTPIAGMPVL